MDDLISRRAAISYAVSGLTREVDGEKWIRVSEVRESIETMPSAQPEQTLYGYPIEHLEMIAMIMAKENCTPEAVAQMLQNVGEVAKMVRDEVMKMLKESIERTCKGEANELV